MTQVEGKLGIIADVHANLGALTAVLAHATATYGSDLRFIQLGDLVNYGPRPNEVIAAVRELTERDRVLVNLAGNHEAALNGVSPERFATDRGLQALRVASQAITDDHRAFLDTELSYEPVCLDIAGRRVICVHGSLADRFWGSVRAEEMESTAYQPYDVVLCGHTHVPLLYEQFYTDASSPKRHKKKTAFFNPGSVGQPRNHDPRAQYAVWDMGAGAFHFHGVVYDIAAEQRHFSGEVDPFYSARLAQGV
jgi:diadenosine tetraphosphatase ApaH/serine/threonine PP2A family protein phosphatase